MTCNPPVALAFSFACFRSSSAFIPKASARFWSLSWCRLLASLANRSRIAGCVAAYWLYISSAAIERWPAHHRPTDRKPKKIPLSLDPLLTALNDLLWQRTRTSPHSSDTPVSSRSHASATHPRRNTLNPGPFTKADAILSRLRPPTPPRPTPLRQRHEPLTHETYNRQHDQNSKHASYI